MCFLFVFIYSVTEIYLVYGLLENVQLNDSLKIIILLRNVYIK